MAGEDVHKRVLAIDAIERPQGWIQWKGTDVCIDLHCTCGTHGHVDRGFFYFYRCHGCGQCFAVGSHVRLIPLTPEESAYAAECSAGIIMDEDVDQDVWEASRRLADDLGNP